MRDQRVLRGSDACWRNTARPTRKLLPRATAEYCAGVRTLPRRHFRVVLREPSQLFLERNRRFQNQLPVVSPE